MAACIQHTCLHCGFQIEAWDDGHPYLRGADGTRHYYYHPAEREVWDACYEAATGRPAVDSAELMAFVEAHCGCEKDWLCLNCGRLTRRDPKHDRMHCTGCRQPKLRATFNLEGRTCPKCAQGTFHGEMNAIS